VKFVKSRKKRGVASKTGGIASSNVLLDIYSPFIFCLRVSNTRKQPIVLKLFC